MPIRSPVVDEIETLEAVALELLAVVAFVAYLEVVVAFLAESVVDEQSNMGGTICCTVFLCAPLLRVLVVAFLVRMFRILKVDLLTFIIVHEVCT